ncbi:ComF family protein [Pseudomonas sp. RIT-PI-S]|uniref:ComF family protein n=1 Tax=Pseudomonas sp. RIT-PI-S TaxID=3035295 RepID=UPI0021DA4D98|nr:ComF family protein [Pseudomonas sp. RIT-PI-S]
MAFDGPLCSGCQNSPPPFEQTEAPWAYDFPLDAAIKRFKHRGDRPMGRLLGDRLGAWLLHRFNEGLPRPQRMLPVPLAAQRLRVRGFNQSQLLAERLSKSFGITVADHAVVRIRDTPSQQHLDLPARQRNLRGAFGLAPNASVRGLHLALVDDVMTTGATAHAIATLLRQAGARRVDVYCLARTPGPPRP